MADRVTETHCSTIALVGDLVYKRKKPVDLGFLDFRSPEARRAACAAEVELNRRFAPNAYLGVATLTGPGTPWGEPLVVMRRMPSSRRLSTLVRTPEDVGRPLRALARVLAQVHRTSPAPAHLVELGAADRMAELWQTGTEALRELGAVPEALREHSLDLALRYLGGRGPLLADRVAHGRVVDGHGDLLADDVFLLEDGPCALDCLEFDERLRVGDGLLDAAFLAMDLERLGRPDLARVFLDAYRRDTSDDAPVSLEHHFIAYRAHVRAKVAAVRASQTGLADDEDQAAALARLAHAHLETGRVRVVVVGGGPGSGKTTVAEAVGAGLGARVLSSDVVRKSLHGLAPESAAPSAPGEGLYAPAVTERTYARLRRLAEESLRAGTSVVLDATFADDRHRDAVRSLAASVSADLVELCCEVDDRTADDRLRTRLPGASDATPAVRAWWQARKAPWPEATCVATDGPPVAARQRALLEVLRPSCADPRGLSGVPDLVGARSASEERSPL